jgi:hypothetical protein
MTRPAIVKPINPATEPWTPNFWAAAVGTVAGLLTVELGK